MSDNKRKPDFTAVVSTEREGQKPFYNKIGAGWMLESGNISCRFFANSTDGSFLLCPVKDSPEETEE